MALDGDSAVFKRKGWVPDRVIYRVRNDGPQDLDSVLMYQPRTRDRITYPVMRTGDPNGWADDEAELGPLAMTQEVAVTLCCGAAGELPRLPCACRMSRG